MGQLIADTGYSSGEALQYCQENNIDAYIPNFGQYKFEREGFTYNEKLDQYECQRGNKAILPCKGIRARQDGYQYKQYSAVKVSVKTVSYAKNAVERKQNSKR